MTSLGASSPIVSSSTLSSPSTMRAKHWLSSWRATVGAVLDFLYNGVDLFHFPPIFFHSQSSSACFTSLLITRLSLLFLCFHCQPCLRRSHLVLYSIAPAPSRGLMSTSTNFFVLLSGPCRLTLRSLTGGGLKNWPFWHSMVRLYSW